MSFKENTIDRSTIEIPVVLMTQRAQSQIRLIKETDFTLEETVLRVEISGKDCHGFTYAFGFTPTREDDFVVPVGNCKEGDLQIHLDPFAAYYLREASIDFIQDFEKDSEGFVIINLNQERFAGKFWKAAPEWVPKLRPETDQTL